MPEKSPELRAVVERLFAALERGDGATAANMFLRSPDMRYVGTDPEEWWSGPDMVDAYPTFVEGWPPHHNENLELEAYQQGSVGWVAARSTLFVKDARPTSFRFTAVLVLESGIWRIVQVHRSMGESNLESFGVDMTTSLSKLLESIEGRQAVLAGRHGTVTLVFTDIEDSTPLAVQLGDAAWISILNDHHRIIASAATSHGGEVVKTLGDGAMLAFGSSREAVRAAIEIQQRLDGGLGDMPLSVRVGVHSGDAVAADNDYLGSTVNKAARIAAAAEGGQIMASESVRALLGDDAEFRFGASLSVTLKGLAGVHLVAPVLWRR